jgi:hypothetical protein
MKLACYGKGHVCTAKREIDMQKNFDFETNRKGKFGRLKSSQGDNIKRGL